MELLGVSRRLRAATDRTSESGWALLETMFAAGLLVVVALAVMSSLDVASRTSAANKGRSVASALAEQDQERMRAMTIDKLSNYHATSNPTVGGLTYNVDSRAEWIRDATGTAASCSDTGQSDYIRISTTVTSSVVGRDTKPITIRGIVAPPVGSLGPNQGTRAVKVVDHNDAPVPNMPVALTGTKALSDVTNSLGCAVFGYIPGGAGTSYDVELNAVNWVDQDGNQRSIKSPNVTPGNVTLIQMTYDRAGSVGVVFRNSANVAPTPAPNTLSINNSLWPTPGVRRVPPPTVTSLFPFATSPYSLYAGSCNSANPSLYTGESASSAAVLPAQATTGVIVRVPTITVTVLNSSSNPVANAGVTLKASGTGCTEEMSRDVTGAAGTITEDLPYGTYTVCADQGGKRKTGTVSNVKGTGPNALTIRPTLTPNTNGTCPTNP
jgi:type II secretory pathway pseudopilin PulG